MTLSTTTYSRGDIVLVPFPFSDREAFKSRPALVISSSIFNASRNDLIIAALTSRIRDPLLSGDYRIQDWCTAGVTEPSVVTSILRTTKSYLVVRKMGELPQGEMEAVDALLRQTLGL